MAKSANQKRKLPILAKMLLERSDEEHPISRQEMQEELERWGLSAERKSLYDDMEQLNALGLDVQSKRGRGGGWYVGQRDFELAELKLLVDAVQSSRFLTRRKSDALIRKLEGLTSVHQARQLQRQVYVDRRIKTMNESIFYNVDRLHGAIAAGRVTTFRYFEYNAARERVYRRDGAKYRVTPYGLIWDSENYYLAGWDELHKELRHYRVDKMTDITVTGMRGTPVEDWTPEGYARRHFGNTRCLSLNRYDYLKAQKRNGEFTVQLTELEECLSAPDTIENQYEQGELSSEISAFLRTLSSDKRNIFIRRYWFSDSITDIAKRFDLSESKVKSILFRVRKQLKQHLESEGYRI